MSDQSGTPDSPGTGSERRAGESESPTGQAGGTGTGGTGTGGTALPRSPAAETGPGATGAGRLGIVEQPRQPLGAADLGVVESYRARIDALGAVCDQFARRDGRLTLARGWVFLGAAILGATAWFHPAERLVWGSAAGTLFVGFLGLCVWHERVLEVLAAARLRRQINRDLLARKERRFRDYRTPRIEVPQAARAVAGDLDLFGQSSLFHLLCTCETPTGRATLQQWLLEPADPDELVGRREAIEELVPQRGLREELQLRGRQLEASREGTEAFVAWAKNAPWLAQRPWLIWLPRLSSLAIGLLLIGAASGLAAPRVAAVGVGALVLLHLLLIIRFGGKAQNVFERISSTSRQVQHYCALFELLYGLKCSSRFLSRVHEDLTLREGGALARLRQLRLLMVLPNLRRSPLTFLLLYLPLQILTCWDLHCLAWIEQWQAQSGKQVPAWFDALGRLEALAALASLAADEPAWTFGEVDSEMQLVQGTAVGHPLLSGEVRVANDVQLGPPGTFLLITGSNMSGKSTLLRSVGLNVILAQMGSVVCARALRLPPLLVETSIRVSDSLESGVSFYMAELRRLKEIVDQAARQAGTPRRMLYLLDEILQGTNSRERQIAVQRVITYLVNQGALGAVTTHDLELADHPELAALCQLVHFRETLLSGDDGQRMAFDYRMRSGPAPTTNALKLLEIVGIG